MMERIEGGASTLEVVFRGDDVIVLHDVAPDALLTIEHQERTQVVTLARGEKRVVEF